MTKRALNPFEIGNISGNKDAATAEMNAAIIAAWPAMTDDTREATRYNWVIGYMAGRFGYSRKDAQFIVDTKRTERDPENHKHADTARKQWDYYVGKAVKAPKPSNRVVAKLPKGLVSEMAQRIAEAGLDKAQFAALLVELRGAVSFE